MNLLNKILPTIIGCGQWLIDARKSNHFTINLKKDHSIVTNFDLKIQEVLNQTLIKSLPHSVIIGEESYTPNTLTQAQKSEFIWIVDPIDGTKSFTDLNSFEFGIAICLLKNGIPILSVFYAPELKFYNETATLFTRQISDETMINNLPFSHYNKNRIQTSQNNSKCLLIGRKYIPESIEAKVLTPENIVKPKHPIASIAQLCKLCNAETYQHIHSRIIIRQPKVWDVLAGVHLLQGMGGKATYLNNQEIFPFSISDLIKEDPLQEPRIKSLHAQVN